VQDVPAYSLKLPLASVITPAEVRPVIVSEPDFIPPKDSILRLDNIPLLKVEVASPLSPIFIKLLKVEEAATLIEEEAERWPAEDILEVALNIPAVRVPIVELEVKSPCPK
jgi:hypothetical protein